MDEILAKLRSETVEKMFQMGYSLNGEFNGDTIIRLEFYEGSSPAVFVEINKKWVRSGYN